MAEAMNFETELRRLQVRDPFEAFIIKLTNGESFDITDPLQFALAPEGNTGMVFHPRRGMVFFRKNQIVSVHANETQEH